MVMVFAGNLLKVIFKGKANLKIAFEAIFA